jgi:hypothetical protein
MIAFVLPLAWLRFFWWRLNIWGEAAGVLLGLPLGYLIWFPLGFSRRPFWLGFFVLFLAGWLVILLATYLTRPENPETLQRFYDRCSPAGLWGPVTRSLPAAKARAARQEIRVQLITCLIGVLLCGSMVVSLNALFAGWSVLALGSCAVMLLSGLAFIRRSASILSTADVREPRPHTM